MPNEADVGRVITPGTPEHEQATDRIRFDSAPARYVRVSATKRAGNQTWSGYKLMALEVPGH